MGVGFNDLTLEEAVAAGVALVEAEGFHCAVTPNPESLPAAKHNPAFRQTLLGAGLASADGVGVVYSAKILGRPLKGKVPSIDFTQQLLAQIARHGKRLFLLGVKPGVAELVAANLKDAHPGLIVCGAHDGYFREDDPMVKEIRTVVADVVLACLGAPKQELQMAEHGPVAGTHLMVGLDSPLDMFAGVVGRAPEGPQRLGLEWLYRLAKEPKHIGRMAKLPLVLVQVVGTQLWGK